MGIGALGKVKAKRVIGIDASTNSLAFAIFEGETPIQCGEIKFNGSSVFERLKDAKRKTRVLVEAGVLKGDYIAIESAIMVRNVQTAIDLAYVYGAILGELGVGNSQLEKVAPISWQSYIGVKNLTKQERDVIVQEFPGKSKTWYQNKGRQIRKSKIAEKAAEYFPDHVKMIEQGKVTDNVTDAIGIAYYASTKLTR